MPTQTLRFLRRGQVVTVHDVPPDRTLLELLREDLACTGTKVGCGEGDCGACTVVIGQTQAGAGGREELRLSAINSCIRLAHSIDGLALWTVEDIHEDPLIVPPAVAGDDLHPAQQAMVDCHGSQCGFCTPGFVMSLFALYENQADQGHRVDRELACRALSGNLCRCTGYRPILDAAQRMAELPEWRLDHAETLQKLQLLEPATRARQPDFASNSADACAAYLAPAQLAELLRARALHPQAQVVAGCTDVGLWVTKQHRQFNQVLDVTRAAELQRIEHSPGWLRIGAAATLSASFAALVRHWPQLQEFAARFAGLPVRNSGTLGGNVANGSPIGDSMPVLIALGAEVVLASVRGERRIAIEDFYTGYRQNVLAPDELLARIDVPLPSPGQLLRVYKVSKRFDDDISAVCLAFALELDGPEVVRARIGAGGVAATPARATAAEQVLLGQAWSQQAAATAGLALQAQFEPISDMRASGAYRRTLLANLMLRLWLESQAGGDTTVLTRVSAHGQDFSTPLTSAHR